MIGLCAQAGVWGIINFGIGLTLREGNREYFYAALDRHFPGLSERYQKKYGYSYEVPSENDAALMQVFHRECERHGIVHDNSAIFRHMGHLPDRQMSLF